ncbi:MAG: hypothetical protein GY815_00235 [Gammaproteobacteria bacterium]|nr:hypothetical protein [Gammaproteobacteria bacterium]
MAVVVVVIMLVAAGIGYWSKGTPPPEQPELVQSKTLPLPDKPSIAVLSFDNLSGDPGQEYLSDGISQNIITGLSQFPGLFVIARQSSFSYKGKAVKVHEIASELGVQYIIEGSVQKSDSRVRVTAQFVDLMWGWTDDPEKSEKLSLEHAQSAVSLNNTDAEAHWVLGATLIYTGQGGKDALVAYERALALSPNNADLLAEYGWNIPYLGRAEEAVKLIRKAMRLNPVYPDWYGQALMFALYNARRYEEVVAVSKTIDIRHVMTLVVLAGSYAYMGQLDKAHLSAAQVMEINPDFTRSSWREGQVFSQQVALDHYMDGLRKAGLP